MCRQLVRRSGRLALIAFSIASLLSLSAGSTRAGETGVRAMRPQPVLASAETVELFAALDAAQIEVRYIPRDEAQGRLFVTNRTDQPLNVRLPDVFAARPVLAQFFPSGSSNQTSNSPFSSTSSTQQNNQSVGTNSSTTFFCIPAERVVEVPIESYCLNLGLPSPRPVVPYAIVPLDSISSDPLLAAVLREGFKKDADREVVQAAIWHVANETSWDEIAKLRSGERHPVRGRLPMLTARQLDEAKDLVAGLAADLPAGAASVEVAGIEVEAKSSK